MIDTRFRNLRAVAGAAVLAAFSLTQAAVAEHAKISLDVSTRDDKQTAFVDQTPPDVGKNPRPVLKATQGEPLDVEYLLTNVYPHKTLENVVVHFYFARVDKVGRRETPDLSKRSNIVLETAFDLDLKPGGKAGGRCAIPAPAPGVYMIRVESIRTGSDHEHFAAIDLVVEAKP
jgi:hypothetical protein